MPEMILNAKIREDFGKGASKKIRRHGLVPAMVYGGTDENVPLAVDPKQIYGILRSEAGRNTILSLEVDGGGKDSVILKDWQVDPVKESILHADFQRIAMDQLLRVSVPVAIRGEAIGVTAGEGLLDLVMREVEVECLPADIPERIECDVSALHLHDSIRIGDLPPLEGVEIFGETGRVIVHVVALRAEEEESVELAEGEIPSDPDADESGPEIVSKGKKEDEGSE